MVTLLVRRKRDIKRLRSNTLLVSLLFLNQEIIFWDRRINKRERISLNYLTF
jgi:hypothetical protein